MHSSKAKKTKVLEALGEAWNDQGASEAAQWEAEALRLKGLRDSLNLYVERLHRQRPNGWTVYQALGHAVAGHEVSNLPFDWTDPSTHDVERIAVFREIVERLEVHSKAFGIEDLTRTPLQVVEQAEWTPLWQSEFLKSVRALREAADKFGHRYQRLAELARLSTNLELTPIRRGSAAELASALPSCLGANWGFVTRPEGEQTIRELLASSDLLVEHRSVVNQKGMPWSEETTAACHRGLALLRTRKSLYESAPDPWPAAVISELERGVHLFDRLEEEERHLGVRYEVSKLAASAMEGEWRKADQSYWPLSTLVRRRIRKTLRQSVLGGGDPNPENDLPILARIEKIRKDIEAIDLRILPTEVWSGLATKVEIPREALLVQSALRQIKDGGACEPLTGLELVASGLAGPVLKQSYGSLTQIAEIDSQLGNLQWLAGSTNGLWASTGTSVDALSAAV